MENDGIVRFSLTLLLSGNLNFISYAKAALLYLFCLTFHFIVKLKISIEFLFILAVIIKCMHSF